MFGSKPKMEATLESNYLDLHFSIILLKWW